MNKSDKEASEFEVGAKLVSDLAGDVKDIVCAMLRAAVANPLLGIVAAVIIVDSLAARKVITPIGAGLVYIAIGLIEAKAAADIADALLAGDYTALWGAVSVNRPAPTSTDLTPIPTNVTFADSMADRGASEPKQAEILSKLGALLGKTTAIVTAEGAGA